MTILAWCMVALAIAGSIFCVGVAIGHSLRMNPSNEAAEIALRRRSQFVVVRGGRVDEVA